MSEAKSVEIVSAIALSQRCSCYDEDCHQVQDPLKCWIGGEYVAGEVTVVMPIADGYCPLLRAPSPAR